jgi:hypothetical protein
MKIIFYFQVMFNNSIGGIIVSMLAASVVDVGSSPGLVKPQDKIGICCFSANSFLKYK